MTTASELLTKAATESLDLEMRRLLHRYATEDHDEVVWVSFSDDEGATRIVFRAFRQDAQRALGLLEATELRDKLAAARVGGHRKVMWGLAGD